MTAVFLLIGGSQIGSLFGRTGSNLHDMTVKIEQNKTVNNNFVFIMIVFKNLKKIEFRR